MTTTDTTETIRERRMQGPGTLTDRTIPVIDLQSRHDPAARARIADELWAAGTEIGFFQVRHHGIDRELIEAAFAVSEDFFALPAEVKRASARRPGANAGYESLSQIRPSMPVPDPKETIQITVPAMAGLWPDETAAPEFRSTVLRFEDACRELAVDLLGLLAPRMGLDEDFFRRAHDPSAATYQCTLRLLHYFATTGIDAPARGGAHTDFDALTLLFQRAGQGGLQVCPGRDMESQAWTAVDPDPAVVTCNIGDMLMRWSGDQLASTFHRVMGPPAGVTSTDRYSIAFFAQANTDTPIEAPDGSYPTITAGEFLTQRINANYQS